MFYLVQYSKHDKDTLRPEVVCAIFFKHQTRMVSDSASAKSGLLQWEASILVAGKRLFVDLLSEFPRPRLEDHT